MPKPFLGIQTRGRYASPYGGLVSSPLAAVYTFASKTPLILGTLLLISAVTPVRIESVLIVVPKTSMAKPNGGSLGFARFANAVCFVFFWHLCLIFIGSPRFQQMQCNMNMPYRQLPCDIKEIPTDRFGIIARNNI